MGDIKLTGEMYGITIKIKDEFDESDNTDFHKYLNKRLRELRDEAIERMANDELEGIDEE